VGPPGGRGLIRVIGLVGNFSSAARATERDTRNDTIRMAEKKGMSFFM
jgi:hypothetical protein